MLLSLQLLFLRFATRNTFRSCLNEHYNIIFVLDMCSLSNRLKFKLNKICKDKDWKSKLSFCIIWLRIFYQFSWVHGRLPETENKRMRQISGLKSGRGWAAVAYKRVFELAFDWKTKRLFTKWSLTGGGCLREVVARRDLTVFLNFCKDLWRNWSWAMKTPYKCTLGTG